MTEPLSPQIMNVIQRADPQVMSAGLGIIFRPIKDNEARQWFETLLQQLGCKIEKSPDPARVCVSLNSVEGLMPYLPVEVQSVLPGTMSRKYGKSDQTNRMLDLDLSEGSEKAPQDLALLSRLIWTERIEGDQTFIYAQVTSDVKGEAIMAALKHRNIDSELKEEGKFLRITLADWERLSKELPPAPQVSSVTREDIAHTVSRSLRKSILPPEPGGR